MKTIVFANPNPKSFTYAIKDSYLEFLKSQNEKFEIIDLYSKDEYKIVDGYSLLTVREFQNKILLSDELVFIHPLYWISMPAIMKSFFEQVFTEGFAYDYIGDNRDFVPRLTNKTAHIILTGNGKRSEYEDFSGRTDFEIVWCDMLQAAGFSHVRVEYIGGMDRMEGKERNAILRSIEDRGVVYK
jgi:NAD(P)H dehydrogenase (quinone)